MPAFKWDEDHGSKYRWLIYGIPGAHLKANRKTLIK